MASYVLSEVQYGEDVGAQPVWSETVQRGAWAMEMILTAKGSGRR